MIKIISSYFFVFFLLFIQCTSDSNENTDSEKDSINQKDLVTDSIESSSTENENYSYEKVRIDSVKFNLLKSQTTIKKEHFYKVTDINKAIKLLKNKALFKQYRRPPNESNAGDTGWIYLSKIYAGSVIIDDSLSSFFEAYYPDEEIILLEGGHTRDQSYNVLNGESTEMTGNPERIITSPNKIFRLNGYFGGQECVFYFIQKNTDGKFKKIISLNETNDDDEYWTQDICIMEEPFWSDDYTLNYFISPPDSWPKKEYFQLKIISK